MPTPSRGIAKKMKRLYFPLRNSDFLYRRILNYSGNRKLQELVPVGNISGIQRNILTDLDRDGIASIPVTELLPKLDFEVLKKWIIDNETNLVQREKKKFLFSYYGTENPEKPLDLQNPIIAVLLNRSILEIVSLYLNYVPQLYEVYIEKTMPIGEAAPTYSQNWHRDPEEKRTLKVFLYLNNVEKDSGPFIYVKRSHPTGGHMYGKLFPQELPWGSYPTETDVLSRTDESSHYVGTAGAGTLIFCDTAGIHRGGLATKKPRVMATAFFPSKRYTEKRLFKSPTKYERDIFHLDSLLWEVVK